MDKITTHTLETPTGAIAEITTTSRGETSTRLHIRLKTPPVNKEDALRAREERKHGLRQLTFYDLLDT